MSKKPVDNRVDEITIVGGGTAGWLTATFLITALNAQNPDNPLKLNVIVSPDIPSVGVGESTLPIMSSLLELLDINEAEFLLRCNATFKCAGRFVNWDVDPQGNPRTFITPFNSAENINGYHPAYYFKRFGSLISKPEYVDNIFPSSAVIDAFKGPRTLDMGQYEGAIGYSYHLDAKLFAEVLQEIAIERGVNFISDDVLEVKQAENGFISSLQLKERGDFPVKFVVDCTGFKGKIIREVLKEPFESYRPYFLCDRALPVIMPHKHPKKIRPATTATGLSAGWAWEVPLYNRVGTGYVYSSAFIDDDAAHDELMKHLGGGEPIFSPGVVKFEVGVSKRNWVKNCVALGLAGGFVEPLEATAIGMIDKAARWLAAYLPDQQVSPEIANQFNKLMDTAQKEIRDFIFMHYYLSNRLDTPFWRAVRYDMQEPDTLIEKLELWTRILPTPDATLGHQMFDWENYMNVLFGKGFLHNTHSPLEPSMTLKPWKQYNDMLRSAKDNMVKHLPGHYDLLTHIRNTVK